MIVHQCKMSDGVSVTCICSTGADHTEEEMDSPPAPSDDDATSCDWGGCDDDGVTWRWAPDLGKWLPVCEGHRP